MPLQGMFLQLMGEHATADDCRQATPSAFARKDFAPTMLIHGTGDELVPWKESRRMYDALVETGAPVELHLLEGLPHAFDANSAYSKGLSTFIDLFLKRHMAPREAAVAAG
jgi:dipeptidyl aminopeptidase/acylaminoacyl peptidase